MTEAIEEHPEMSFKLQISPDGSAVESNPDRPQTVEGAQPSGEPRVRMQQQGVMRMKLDGETGEAVFETSKPREAYRAAPAVQHGVSVRGGNGLPTVLALATPDSVVDIPGLGTSSAAAYVTMGYLTPRAGGIGYELCGEAAPSAPVAPPQAQPLAQLQTKADAPKPDAAASVADPADLRGVQPTSATSDATLRMMSSEAPLVVEGIINSIARGVEPTEMINDAGKMLRDEAFPSKATALYSEMLSAGQQALRNVGVENVEEFQAFAESHPDVYREAVRELVQHKSVSALTRLGRKFVSESANRLVTLLNAKNVDAVVEGGTVYVSRKSLGLPPTPRAGDFGDSDRMSLREAIRAGYIEFVDSEYSGER
jgi:hypothetical protein